MDLQKLLGDMGMTELYEDPAVIEEAVKLCPDDNEKAMDMLLSGEVQNMIWERE